MLDLRKKIFIIISVVVALILVFVLLYFFVFNKEVVVEPVFTPDGQPITQADGSQTINPIVKVPVNPVTDENGNGVSVNSDEFYTKQVAKIFVERFLTYSNQNNNQHIDDVLPLVAPGMVSWITQQTINEGDIYQGLTTKVITAIIDTIDESSAMILVNTQQIFKSNGQQEINYKNGRVNLVKLDNDWKVSGFYWE